MEKQTNLKLILAEKDKYFERVTVEPKNRESFELDMLRDGYNIYWENELVRAVAPSVGKQKIMIMTNKEPKLPKWRVVDTRDMVLLEWSKEVEKKGNPIKKSKAVKRKTKAPKKEAAAK